METILSFYTLIYGGIMPDISMCKDNSCPSRKRCYRWMAVPAPIQSYMDFKCPPNEDKCDDFWDMWPEEEQDDGEDSEG